jgi:hypothetical protein
MFIALVESARIITGGETCKSTSIPKRYLSHFV